MRILVDADACPVKKIIVELARENSIEVIMFFDNAHVYEDGYSKVYIIDKGADSVDYFLINRALPNDIVVTGDYGLASMALAKKTYPISPRGLIYNEDNIMGLLSQRAFSQKLRKHKNLKGPKKRVSNDDEKFRKSLNIIISNK
jgi:uncharacterized protein YaiI (UPF0178 family)